MSNVFRALEKAEREKQIRPVREEPLIEMVDVKPLEPRNDGPVLKDLAKEIEKFDLPGLAEESIPVAEAVPLPPSNSEK